MNELDATDRASSRSVKAATVVGLLSVMWITARLDRRYDRWESRLRADVSPFTRPRARLDRMRVGFQNQRDVFGDVTLLISTVMHEIEAAKTAG